MRILDLKSGHTVLLDEDDYAALNGRSVYAGQNGYAYVALWINGASRPNTLHAEIRLRVTLMRGIDQSWRFLQPKGAR